MPGCDSPNSETELRTSTIDRVNVIMGKIVGGFVRKASARNCLVANLSLPKEQAVCILPA
jgi:hypothetical protein